ncbi:DUF2272 domain-containing protein [Luteimonas suaedae]|uniref:DUF2272 domain-containing protein n=1 Tax=Luteimonas suaedae TaxID=2605430 RepID=UPI0011ED084F|nr:DUF2272 domain-containing protein [Luteimonas suaedae]
MFRMLWLLLTLTAVPALAADVCPILRTQTGASQAATRIAAFACEEHQLWHRPFIDADGRLAGSTVREAETGLLANGEQAWRRVAGYWRDSGLLGQAAGRPGAVECGYAAMGGPPSAGCRAFIVDAPWSAVFVSWVLRRAGLPGFAAAANHLAYVRGAYRGPEASAYRVADPATARPALGDLLCHVRSNRQIYGFGGLARLLSAGEAGLGMHCDIVVAVDPDRDGLAYLVGGNVLDGVTMRLLPLTGGGRFRDLPMRRLDAPACTPDAPAACNANRQDWAVLLQLRPQQDLARLTPPPSLPAATSPASPAMPAQPAGTPAGCCVHCVAGDTSVPRCPKGASPGGDR